MKNILSVDISPITSYTNIASVSAILWARKTSTLPWFCDHFIQLFGGKTDNKLSYEWGSFYDFTAVNNILPSGLPFLNLCRIDRTVNKADRFTDFIEEQINHNYYMLVVLDRYYLKCSSIYQKEHYSHLTFIYGYDKDEDKIFIADFYDNARFEFVSATYDEINLSYQSDVIVKDNQQWRQHINLYKYINCEYEIDVELIKLSLNDYLLGADSFMRFKHSFTHRHYQKYFGIKYYDLLIEHCKISNKDALDFRAFHVLYEHKELMKIRVRYLLHIGVMCSKYEDTILNNLDILTNYTLKLRNMALKYNISQHKDSMLLKRIINEIKSIIRLDQKVTTEILNVIL